MPFDERWLFVIGGVFFLLSVLWDLLRGQVRVRGYGVFSQREQPGRYWLAVVIKLALAAVLFLIAYLRLVP